MQPERTPDASLSEFSPYVLVAALAVVAILLGFSTRYGYHRDELYFLEAGRHLAWGYPDQPPLVPLVARVLSWLAPNSLIVLRLPSALGAGVTVILTGLLAREMGGDRAAQLLAALCMATAGVLIGTDHYLNTSGFDLLAWTFLLWLVVRILRTGDDRWWLGVGIATGVALFNSDLVAILMAAIVLSMALVGPRHMFASPWLWAGGAVAGLLWLPYLLWQAHHGWPELTVSRAIAAGSSATSTPRSLLVPEQFFLVSPYFSPVWVVGLARMLRAKTLTWCRPIGVTYLVVTVVFLVTGGKSYYLASILPALLAAGSVPIMAWVRRQHARVRRGALVVGFTITAVVTTFFTLPVLPASALHRTFIPSVNTDLGETVAWPTYVAQIARVYHHMPSAERLTTAVLTRNYGEAGAIDHFGPADSLPTAYSGHDSFWYWGPPPARDHSFVVVGFSGTTLHRYFTGCEQEGRLNNELDLKDTEQHTPIWVCGALHASWTVDWPKFKLLG